MCDACWDARIVGPSTPSNVEGDSNQLPIYGEKCALLGDIGAAGTSALRTPTAVAKYSDTATDLRDLRVAARPALCVCGLPYTKPLAAFLQMLLSLV